MPRYVAKEDVEKGLVDPSRPLQEQPEYKQKIEKQTQEKEKHQQPKNVQQRPKKQRPPRNERPKFNWNKNEITLQTKVPEKPKKLLEKPNHEKHKEGLQKLKAERQLLKKQRQALFDQQRAVLRDLTQSKKSGREAISQYSGAMRDKFNLENQLRKQIRILDDQKKKINSEIQYLTSQLNELRKPTSPENFSVEYLRQSIENKEHQLTTAQIGKREQSKLNNQINELKRALVKARPYIQIDSQAKKLEDRIDLLYKQVKPIKHELHVKITEANGIRSELDSLKEQRKTTEGQSKVQRSPEEIKAQYDAKLKALQARRDKLEERIDDYIDKFVREGDDYEDQQDLLKYIKWVEDQIAWLKKKKQQEQNRKKEKQQREKRRQKEKEEYQKRQEERKKQEQQRKARQEARKKKLEEEREKYINRNPNHQIIDLCQSLIGYCESLRPSQFQKYEDNRNKAAGELNFGKEWQKEIKGGAQVIQSKKSKLDEQGPKKQVKPKKKQQKAQDQDFTHGIEVVNQFQSIKLLPPNNVAEIDSAIKLIRDKISFYSNPTQEQKAAFREKAAKQFDERHAPRDRRQGKEGGKQFKQKHQQQGQHHKQKKVHHQKREKKELNAGDFPELA